MLKTRPDVVQKYVSLAPLALAFERIIECRILHAQAFEQPVLDIGCGEGLFAHVLFEGRIDTGIDPNPRELSRARELGAYAELIECKGDAIPKPSGSYRTVLSNSVMEHIPEIEPVLREAHRLLAPGGRLYMTVPSDRFDQYTWISQVLGALGLDGLRRRFSAFFNRFWAHYHFHTPQGWRSLVERCGFEVVEVRPYASRAACLMNTALVPFSVPALVTKKATNRWTLLPALRPVVLAPVVALAERVLRKAGDDPAGGLVFLSLRKGG